jgi:AraC-like DNA-binding protein
MKPVFEKVPMGYGESLHCEVVQGRDYGTRWHFHPEHQLTLAVRSQGHRLVGDHLGALEDGDLVLLGSNLPHVWHQAEDSEVDVEAVIVRFDEGFVGKEFLAKAEMEGVRALLRRAARGLAVTGRVREEVAQRMIALRDGGRLEKIIELLAILARLASAKAGEVKPLASAGYEPMLSSEDQERMERVCAHIHRHYLDKVERSVLAGLAALSEGAFSRFFHSRTGRTVPQYVNELRVGRACRMLLEAPDRTVSDIALDCGFDNLANFNRRFLAAKGMPPSEFRKRSRTAVQRRS